MIESMKKVKDTKLNPYGVTQIDFSKRQELKDQMLEYIKDDVTIH